MKYPSPIEIMNRYDWNQQMRRHSGIGAIAIIFIQQQQQQNLLRESFNLYQH